MRLADKLMEDFIREIAGEDAVELFRVLKNSVNVSEFKLAESLGLTVNKVRNLLYKLVNYNLVYSTRKKDRQKGWYIYYWTFNFKEAKMLLDTLKNRRLGELKRRLAEEKEKKFFTCPDKHVRFELNEAMEHNFKCPECENILFEEDNRKLISKIEEEIGALEHELKFEWEPEAPFREEEEKPKEKIRKHRKKIKKKVGKKKKIERVRKKVKIKKKVRKKIKKRRKR